MTAPVIDQLDCPDGSVRLMFECPGCGIGHHVQTKAVVAGGPEWGWNGSMDRPTFTPSILVRWDFGPERTPKVCHSFVTDGAIQFLGDCTHALAGQTVPLQPWEST